MKHIRKIQNIRVLITIFLVLTFLSAISIFTLRFNLGLDFESAEVAQVEFAKDSDFIEPLTNIFDGKDIKPFETEMNGDFIDFYFKNISQDDKVQIEKIIDESIEEYTSLSFYTYEPTEVLFAQTRLLNTALLSTLVFALYLIFTLKGISLNYGETLSYVFTAFTILAWEALILFGITSAVGATGHVIEYPFVDSLMLNFGLLSLFIVFITLRFVDYRKTHSGKNIAVSWSEFIDHDWPTPVLLSALLGVYIFLPYLVLGSSLIAGGTLVIASIIISNISILVLAYHLIIFFDGLFSKFSPIKKSLDKKW